MSLSDPRPDGPRRPGLRLVETGAPRSKPDPPRTIQFTVTGWPAVAAGSLVLLVLLAWFTVLPAIGLLWGLGWLR